ncbi:MAG: hypothetical protein DHS80DRAFT_28410 [Piptocephalis tieghemiana]|nr:MAG: hypothetical protein DHS80DRAFT_28410 [Piptocephalis tieghemiana]
MSYDPIKEFAERQPRKILHRNWDEAHMKKLNRRLQLNARPPSWTRWTQVFSYVLCGGITYYTVLHYDPGYSNHCYMPIRRWVERKKNEFWSLNAEDEKELEESGRVQW